MRGALLWCVASRRSVTVVLLGTLFAATGVVAAAPVPVEIRAVDGGHRIYRGGQPYEIRGAGTQRIEDLESLARHGGNSVRTWSTDDAGPFLDRAHALGLTVALCLDVQRERLGFDYDDESAVRAQFEVMRAEVLRYRNHPALLVWIIGNELNYDFTNPRVYDAVNDIARMIRSLDPNHPSTTATAGLSAELANTIAERAPDLDFISVQLYGGLFSFEDALRDMRPAHPLMLTEWGTIGHWEVDTTSWGAPIELSSRAKARTYQRGYQEVIRPLGRRLLGDYVFLWSYKQERTPTWYSLFSPDGGRTEAVDMMQKLWTGAWPANRAPTVGDIRLDGRTARDDVRLYPGRSYVADVEADDHEGDLLRIEWRLLRESTASQVGGDAEYVPEDVSRWLGPGGGKEVTLEMPNDPGAYRLFVYVRDASGGVAHANLPFYLLPSDGEKK